MSFATSALADSPKGDPTNDEAAAEIPILEQGLANKNAELRAKHKNPMTLEQFAKEYEKTDKKYDQKFEKDLNKLIKKQNKLIEEANKLNRKANDMNGSIASAQAAEEKAHHTDVVDETAVHKIETGETAQVQVGPTQ